MFYRQVTLHDVPPESGIVDEQGDRGLKTFRDVQASLY